MKQLLLALFAACALGSTASARRLEVGVRGGINTNEYRFVPVQIDETTFRPAPSRTGYEVGLVLRLNLTKVLHLQSEFNYDFVNYTVRRTTSGMQSDIKLNSERIEVPVQLGLQFGIVRLFGGASFRIGNALRSTQPELLKVRFGDERIAWMGGAGLNIKHFFVDFRVQGYPGSHRTNTFVSHGTAQKVRMRSDLVWGGSLGFFF